MDVISLIFRSPAIERQIEFTSFSIYAEPPSLGNKFHIFSEYYYPISAIFMNSKTAYILSN